MQLLHLPILHLCESNHRMKRGLKNTNNFIVASLLEDPMDEDSVQRQLFGASERDHTGLRCDLSV